jgi:glycosyltransferase involved in cell wall biosynthesis
MASNPKPLSILALVKRWKHHTPSGGYDRLAQEVGARVVRRRDGSSVWYHLARRCWQRLHPSRLSLCDYQYGDWLAEYEALILAQAWRPAVVHVLYGDEQLNVLLRWRRLLGRPLIATFHLPASYSFVRNRFRRVARAVDAAIVVSQQQIQDYESCWPGLRRVFFVPLGVDTERFSPQGPFTQHPRLHLATVGDHLRDWETLHRVIDECNALNLPVHFDVVDRGISRPFLTGCANTMHHEGIPEQDLVTIYRNADALLLPLRDATANQAVLEALACGTPVISSRVGGVPDYLDESCGWLTDKGETEVLAMVSLIQELCQNRDVAASKRQDARRKADEFAWEKVALQAMSVYQTVLRRERRAGA